MTCCGKGHREAADGADSLERSLADLSSSTPSFSGFESNMAETFKARRVWKIPSEIGGRSSHRKAVGGVQSLVHQHTHPTAETAKKREHTPLTLIQDIGHLSLPDLAAQGWRSQNKM